jgi:hypothetical protein
VVNVLMGVADYLEHLVASRAAELRYVPQPKKPMAPPRRPRYSDRELSGVVGGDLEREGSAEVMA